MAFHDQCSLFIEDQIEINNGVTYTTQAGTILKPNGIKIEVNDEPKIDFSKRPSSQMQGARKIKLPFKEDRS